MQEEHAEAPMAPSGLEQLRQRGLSAAVWVGGRRRAVREKSRIGGQEEVDSAHLEHGARRKVGGVRMASGDLDDGVLRNVQAAQRDEKKETVDCIENDKAPKAPIAGKKKKRSTDEDENEQGATKYLNYGKGIEWKGDTSFLKRKRALELKCSAARRIYCYFTSLIFKECLAETSLTGEAFQLQIDFESQLVNSCGFISFHIAQY